MNKYVVFLNDETWIIVDADDYLYRPGSQTLKFYRDGEFVARFNTDKIIGFSVYEKVLLRILKNQKVCNGFEAVEGKND